MQKFIHNYLYILIFMIFQHSIIIKLGPKTMFYYSLFNPQYMSTVVLAFIQPLQAASVTHHQRQVQSCSYFSDGSNQETKDALSPTPQNLEKREENLPAQKHSNVNIKADKNKKIKLQIQQEQFIPNVPEIKKGRKTPQNANRNVVPNIMHQVVSFLQKKNKSERLVKQLIENLGVSQFCSVRRFYLYQLLIKQKLNNYVNVQSLVVLNQIQQPLCKVYTEIEQIHYNKISRLLVQYFLSQDYNTIILTSNRVSSNKRFDHLIMKRKILQKIKQMYKSDLGR